MLTLTLLLNNWFSAARTARMDVLPDLLTTVIRNVMTVCCSTILIRLSNIAGIYNWPRRLCVRHPRWRLQCVAGHCYYHRSVFLFLAQAALRAPPEVAFAMRSWPLLLPSFSLSSIVNHPWWRMKRSWPLFSPTFFSFFFFYAFCFSPTSGKLPRLKICFPQYFGITRRYMQKIIIYFFYQPCGPYLEECSALIWFDILNPSLILEFSL